MKIVFMGTPDLAAEVLDAMMRAGCNVTLAVTQPDRPKGRGRGVVKTPVHICADKWGIPVFSPVRVKDEEAVERLRREEPDLIVVAAFGQILSKEILELPRLGCVNVHASLLPHLRGAAPIQWAILEGDEVTGVTIMQMNEGLDTGDILLKEEIAIAPDETGESLYNKLAALGGSLLVRALPAIEKGELTPVRQDDAAASYARMLKRDMGNIDWSLPAASIERLVRGLNSWPSAYTFWQGKMLKIWKSTVADREPSGEPGTVADVDRNAIYVNCGEGVLALEEVQLEGKKRMPVQAFLLGNPVQAGQKFDSVK